MAEPWSLLVLVVAVAAGLVTATASALLVRSRRTAFFRYFLAQTLLFNLLILFGLGLGYVEERAARLAAPPDTTVLPVAFAAMAVLKLGWLYAFAGMTMVLPGQDLPPGFRSRCTRGAIALYVVWVALLAAGRATGSGGAVQGLLAGMEVVVLGGATAACVHLLARSRALPPGRRRRSMAVLGTLYLAVFGAVIGSQVSAWARPAGRTPGHLVFNGVLLAAYNVLPLLWLWRFQPTGAPAGPGALERYGITPREREVIDLICEGRTNQEIADRLFISLATVKDHNSNVFRKTGVRNRVELANLMRDPGAG